MRKAIFLIFVFSFFILLGNVAYAQCAMCTKTAMQLGEKPALGLNNAILYLIFTPFAIVGVIGYRWWKTNKLVEDEENMGESL